MAVFPTEVSINEANIAKITTLYQEAYKQIIQEMRTATSFGIANRKAILRQIKVILAELGVETTAIMREEINTSYEAGANQAINQLEDVGAPVKVKTGFNLIHKEAIVALMDDTSLSFANSLTGVGRSAQMILNDAVKQKITQEIALGKVAGRTLRDVKRNVIGVLADEGLSALTDRSGRNWSLDRYSEMLIRTKAVEARNTGMMNRIVENDYDLVQVSSHGATDQCGKWEGEILSVTGRTKGYKTVQQARDDGLFHPNCKHAINVIVPELAKETRAYLSQTQLASL